MLTFNRCEEIVGNRDSKKLGNNTFLLKMSDKEFAVRLHNSLIVRIFDNGTYTVSTCGFNTATTRERINKYSPARVYHKKKQLFLDNSSWDGKPRKVNSNGEIC